MSTSAEAGPSYDVATVFLAKFVVSPRSRYASISVGTENGDLEKNGAKYGSRQCDLEYVLPKSGRYLQHIRTCVHLFTLAILTPLLLGVYLAPDSTGL